jgi:cytochrome c
MDLVWNEETIDRLFKDGPDVVTPGSKMPIQRITGDKDRADLISYLKRVTAPQ